MAHCLSYNAKLIKAKPDQPVDQVGNRYIADGLLVVIVAFDITGKGIFLTKHDGILNGDSRGMVVWSDDLEIFNRSKDKNNDSFSEIENALDIFLKILQLVFREISCVQFMYFLI